MTDNDLWHKAQNTWQNLTSPAETIRDKEQRQQASLLAGLSFSLLIVIVFVVVIWVWANPQFTAAPYISFGIVTSLSLIYFLSRTRRFQLGAILIIALMFATVGSIIMTAPGPMAERMLALHFLAISVLLSSLLLSLSITIIVILLTLLVISVFFFMPDIPFAITFSYMVFMVIISSLLLLANIMRNRYLREMQVSQRRYRALFHQSNDAVFIIDLGGQHLEVNQSAADMLGYTQEEASKLSFSDVGVPMEDSKREMIWNNLQSRQRTPIFENTFRKKDGTEFPVEVNVELVVDEQNKPIHLQSIVRDVTERKNLEAIRREDARYLRILFEQTPIGIATTDRNGVITNVNPRSLEILGAPDPSALIGLNVLSLQPMIDTGVSSLLSRIIETGEKAEIETSWYTTIWGKRVYLHIRAVPQLDDQGQQVGLIILLEDVSKRVQAEEGMQQAQKLESLSILAGGIAHDFNNLLVAMLGQTSLALAKLSPESLGRRHVEKAVAAAERASLLTQQLLAYSGKGRYQVLPLDLNTLVEENLHLFAATIPKHVHLRTKLVDTLPLVKVDVAQMQQVVMNLIINAAEAIGDERGSITLITEHQTVSEVDNQYWHYTTKPLTAGTYVTLEVHDDGPGMSKETLANLFDPFFTTKEKGHGLGLSAVLGIIKGHNGGLAVYSELGQGTTFKLLLPANQTSEPIKQSTPTADTRSFTGLILVIDDEERVREAVTDILNLEGIGVMGAADGQGGLAMYKEHQEEIALILLDLSMPGWSGEQTMRELLKVNPDVSIILSSGYNEMEATQRFVGRGLAGFLQKPYSAEKLLQTVKGFKR